MLLQQQRAIRPSFINILPPKVKSGISVNKINNNFYGFMFFLKNGASSFNNNYYASNFICENLKTSKTSVFFTAEGFVRTKRPSSCY
jgi:hypothetical protein